MAKGKNPRKEKKKPKSKKSKKSKSKKNNQFKIQLPTRYVHLQFCWRSAPFNILITPDFSLSVLYCLTGYLLDIIDFYKVKNKHWRRAVRGTTYSRLHTFDLKDRFTEIRLRIKSGDQRFFLFLIRILKSVAGPSSDQPHDPG